VPTLPSQRVVETITGESMRVTTGHERHQPGLAFGAQSFQHVLQAGVRVTSRVVEEDIADLHE